MESEVVASRSPEAVSGVITKSSDIFSSRDDIRQSRDTQEMTSVSSRDVDGGDNGTRI